MKVGLVCPYPWDVPGGVQAHVHDLAEALLRLGHDVSVITPVDDKDGADLPGHVVPAGRAVPVPFNGSVARLTFGLVSSIRVRRWLREGEFDVLHVHSPETLSLSLLTLFAATGPIVATFHASYPRSRLLAALEPALRIQLEKVGARIAVSPAARRTVVEHLGGDAVLIPNGVDCPYFAAAEPFDGWPGAGQAIGFLGRIDEPRKGLGVLLAAFERLAPVRPGLRLLVAGPGDVEEVRAALPPALVDRVVLPGLIPPAEKVRAYASVNVFCAPNLGGESFGLVLLEAMAAGTPIVASDLEAFRAVLDDGAAGVLTPAADPLTLADTLGSLLDDHEQRRRLAETGREVARRYDWSTVAASVAAVYDTVALGTAGVVEDFTVPDSAEVDLDLAEDENSPEAEAKDVRP